MEATIKAEGNDRSKYLEKSRLLPVLFYNANSPVTCHNCGYVNHASNNYCTHCGYPIISSADKMALYQFRQDKKQELLQECKRIIGNARASLYVMSLISLVGISYFFTSFRENYLRGGVLLMLSAIYFALARWTISKPFTALLISFLMLISFMAINTWAEFRRMFTTATGVYLLAVQFVLFYFLYRGVKAAYQLDVLEEESSI